MIMDVHAKVSSNSSGKTKRSFDVAFLMQPDNRFKEKHLRVSKQLFINQEWTSSKEPERCPSPCFEERYRSTNVSPSLSQELNIDVGTDEFPPKSILSDSDVSDMSRSRPNSADSIARPIRYIPESHNKNKVFDDPMLIMQSRSRYDRYPQDTIHKSAFTKVSTNFPTNLSNSAAASSPVPSLSPDNLMYQNSISPPLSSVSSSYNKPPQFKGLIPHNHPFLAAANPFFKTQYSNHYDNASSSINHEQSNNEKARLLQFRPDLPSYPYQFPVQNFQQQSTAEFSKYQPQQNHMMTNPAAAILSTLLPPTLAAFSLPAQNVCAKCNISFRMTSDLVYHMRSHHKNEVHHDSNRRKREDKLKCPVCAESFRERHHLTRHMTAHQDKESDAEDQQDLSKTNYSKNKTSNKTFTASKF